jgi:hypothetical protein
MLVFASSALGAETTTTEAIPVPTTSTTPTSTGEVDPAAVTTTSTTSTETKDDDNSDDNRWVAIVIFVLGALGVTLAYVFYDRWRKSYETLALATLTATGAFPETVFPPGEAGVRPLRNQTPPPKLVVTGPATVIVGEPNIFKAAVDDVAADSCTWTVEPEGAATIQPSKGAEVTVTATKSGPLTLSARIDKGEPTTAKLTAIKKTGGGVPLLGTGFAGVAAAIIAFSLAGGLAALDVIGGEAFIAFLGPVVGYFFAQAKETGEKPSAE